MLDKRIITKDRTKLEEVIPLSTPFVVSIDPSSACNLRCSFCYQHDIENRKKLVPGNMGIVMYTSIIDSLSDFPGRVKTLRLYGFGEPYVNPHFPAMVSYAKKSGFVDSIDTTTNGTLITKEKALLTISAGIDRINLSIYGVSSEQYKKFTGADIDFEELVNNLRFLYQNRRQCKIYAKINGDYISAEDKHNFIDIFSEITDGCNIEHTAACWDDVDIKELNKEVDIYGQPLGNEVAVCPYIFYSIQVRSDGTVSLCFLDWNRKLIVGDLSAERLSDVWNSDRVNRIRKQMLNWERDRIIPCNTCGQLRYGRPDNIDAFSRQILGRIK